jgi:nicotinamide-nucleotide amidase
MRTEVNRFIKTLKEKGLTLALAESVTCGMVTFKLSTCKGTSDVLKGSIICYRPEVKIKLLGVSKSLIEKYTCESKEVTEAITRGLSKKIKADIYAGLTGLASAGGSETKSKPVGTIFFCLKYKNKIYHLRKVFRGTPLTIKEKATLELYRFILSRI